MDPGDVTSMAMEVSARRRIAKLEAEITRLRGIVSHLPVTADDVPITPGMTTWNDDVVARHWDIRLSTGETYDHCQRDNEGHYSTRAAAVAARSRRTT